MTYSIDDGMGDRQSREVRLTRFFYDRKTLAPLPMLNLRTKAKPSVVNSLVGWLVSLPVIGFPAIRYLRGRAAKGPAIDDRIRENECLADQSSFDSMDEFARFFSDADERRPLALTEFQAKPEEWFEWSRVAGMNPALLTCVTSAEQLALFDLDPTKVLPPLSSEGKTLRELMEEKRLFVVDHALLSGIRQQRRALGGAKYAPPTAGLFFADRDGKLRSIAIYLPRGQVRPNATNGLRADVYVADGSPAWRMARAYFETADLNHHEIITHLVNTHFCLEGFIVAWGRSFARKHPICELLRVHFANVAFNNFQGRMLLINEGGFASQLLFGGAEGSKELIALGYGGDANYPGFSLDLWDLPEDLRRRGIPQQGGPLTEYPFRDDGLPIWNALERFVTDYVDAWYPSNAEVRDDPQVRQWLHELAHGLVVPRLQATYDRLGATDERSQLIASLVRVIWASGPLHSAVNFSQYDHAAYTPAKPGSAFAAPLPAAHGASASEVDLFLRTAMLPDPDGTILQFKTVSLLTAYHFDEFGDYPPSFVGNQNEKAKAALYHFGQALVACTKAVKQANEDGTRRFPYPYLDPKRVLNSASI